MGNALDKSTDQVAEYSYSRHDREDMFNFVGAVVSLTNAIRLNSRLVAITTIVVIMLAGFYHYVWPPLYIVEAVVSVERTDDPQRDAFYKEWNLFRKEDARTEIELMKSGAVLKAVIAKEGLRYDDVYHPFMSQIGYFWEKSIPGRAYRSFKDWLFGVDADGLTEEQKELGKTIKDMRAGFFVEIAGDVLVGTVYAKGPSPKIAQITNTWMDEYSKWRTEQHVDEAKRSIEALTIQIDKAHREIKELSQSRVDFLGEHGLVFDFRRETQQVDELVKMETTLSSNKTRIDIVTASLDEIEKQLAIQPRTMVVSSVTDLNQLREAAKILRLELEAIYIREQYRFKEDSPEIIRIKRQIADLTDLIESSPETREEAVTSAVNPVRSELLLEKSRLTNELAGLLAAVTSIEKNQEELRAQLAGAPALAAELRDLDRKYAVVQQVYQILLTKSAQADVSLLSETYAMPSMRIVDYATPPAFKTWPKAKYLYPGALVLGLLIGMFAAWLKATFGGRVSQLYFQQDLDSFPLLAILEIRHTDLVLMEQVVERRALPYVNPD